MFSLSPSEDKLLISDRKKIYIICLQNFNIICSSRHPKMLNEIDFIDDNNIFTLN